MNRLNVGKITMTHGIRGELKFYTDFSFQEKILKVGFLFYIKGIPHKISSVRPHKNHYLITLDGLYDINLVEEFRGQEVFIELDDLKLSQGEVIVETLVGFQIVMGKEILGKVKEIYYNKGGVLLKVIGEKSFYIPYQNHFIENISFGEKKIFVNNVKDLIV